MVLWTPLLQTAQTDPPAPLVWTPSEILQTKIPSDIQISPDEKTVLFVVTEPHISSDESLSISRIYKAEIGSSANPVPFTSSDYSSGQPRWSFDGRWVAFLSKRGGCKNLYLIDPHGGEAIALTKGRGNVQTFSWSSDSKKIAFVMSDETDLAKTRKSGSGSYMYQKPTHVNRLWVVDLSSLDPLILKPLTTDDYCVRGCGDLGTITAEFDWSIDNRSLVFAYSPSPGFDHYHLDSSLAIVDIETAAITNLEKRDPFEAVPRYSPDGRWIAYLSADGTNRYAINRTVAIRSADGQHFRKLAPTYNEGSLLAGPNLLGWTRDGRYLLFFEPRRTKYQIVLLPMDGSETKELDIGGSFLKEPSINCTKTMIGFVIQSPTSPPEVYASQLDRFDPIQVSNLNLSLSSQPLPKTEIISWRSSDGLEIEGLLTYPVNHQEDSTYPLLCVIHGGPMGVFDESFLGTPYSYPLASFAEAGFFIFRPNPRGSTGYGKNFRCANYGDWGGKDADDILSGIDALIAGGSVDKGRMGIMGWSYGGYLAAWIISQTDRFRAASLGAGVYNLVSTAGTSDLHRMLPDYLGDFIDHCELYRERSPLFYVDNVTTPCLIQHGIEDKRVPVSQAYELYHALERRGKKPVLILYPGMEHRFSDPKMQIDLMESNLAWFQKHLENS